MSRITFSLEDEEIAFVRKLFEIQDKSAPTNEDLINHGMILEKVREAFIRAGILNRR